MEEHATQTHESHNEVSVPPSVRPPNEAEVSLDEMLSLACRQGKQDIVELLLESGANVNHRNKAGNTPLLEACSQGHTTIAQMLLDHGADIDAPTEPTSDSALTWACTLGNDSVVEILLKRGADVEHRTKDGCTALMFAALAGHVKVTRLLLEHGAKINVESDSNKDSPLTFACWKGHKKVVQLLLEHRANLEHRTKEGFTPLMFAALGGHTDVAGLLLERGAAVNVPSGSNNDIPLTSACWKGHYDVVCMLLKYKSDIEHRTKDGCTPLMLAAREGHYNVARLLLDSNAEVNVPSGSENNIPLTLACWKGHKNVVELLLQHKSKIEHRNKAGCTPLMLAAREGHYDATKLLLEQNAQINVPSGSNDDTPLTLACWKGHTNVVQLLVSNKSNIDHQTKTGCTPLMEATREGHVGVARHLLEAGANVETPDNYGQSPLFMACWKGHSEVAETLLRYNSNKDSRTKTGITPLFQACRENHVAVVRLLLDYGCSVNSPFPNSRECPITLAAEKGHTELVKLLISCGCNVDSKTKKGCSPLYLAGKEGHFEIVKLLHKNGGSLEEPDHRGITPLVASFRNGHVEIVEWLLGHVTHLPSEPECHKSLMAPTGDKEVLLPLRSKCLDMIMKTKRSREQAALKNAQILCEELDAEREKKETKRKNAAKKRDKRKEKKRVQREKKEQVAPEEEDEDDLLDEAGDNGETASPPSPPCLQPTQSKNENKKSRKKNRNSKKKSADVPDRQEAAAAAEDDEEGEEEESQEEEIFMDASDLPPGERAETSASTSAASTKEDLFRGKKQWGQTQSVLISSKGTGSGTGSDDRMHEKAEPSTPEFWVEKNMVVSRTGGRGEWSIEDIEDIDLEQQTDDNKLRSQNAMQKPDRVTSSIAISTSATLTTVSPSVSSQADVSTTTSSPSFWQEVGRNKGITISVPNNLIGRVIGVRGSKINMITEASGSQIHVAKPQGKASGRTITIRGTPKSISVARELIEEALDHPDKDASTAESPVLPPGQETAGVEQASPLLPPSSTMLPSSSSPTTVSQVTSTMTTIVSASNVRGNTAADPEVDLAPNAPPTHKTPWGSANKPPLPRFTYPTSTAASCSTATTTTFVVAYSNATPAVIPPKKGKRPSDGPTSHATAAAPKQIERAPRQPPKEVPPIAVPHQSRPPQASSYSDVASGLRSKAAPPFPVMKPPQLGPPLVSVIQSFTAQKPPGQPKTEQHQGPTEHPGRKTDPTHSESAPTTQPPRSIRQHHRSISDPLRAQPSPKQEVDISASLDPSAIENASSSPPLSASHSSPPLFSQEEESRSLPPASPLPVLPEADRSLSPGSTAESQDHHNGLSFPPPLRQLSALVESPALECKVGQFGPIGAPLPMSTVGPSTPSMGPSTPSMGFPAPSIGPPTPSLGPSTPSMGPPTPTMGPPAPSVGPPTPSMGPPSLTMGPPMSSMGSLMHPQYHPYHHHHHHHHHHHQQQQQQQQGPVAVGVREGRAKKSSYAGLMVETAHDGSNCAFTPPTTSPALTTPTTDYSIESSKLNPLAPEFSIENSQLFGNPYNYSAPKWGTKYSSPTKSRVAPNASWPQTERMSVVKADKRTTNMDAGQYRPHNMAPGHFAKYPANPPLHPPVSTSASFLNNIPHHHHHHHQHHQQQTQGREFGYPMANNVFSHPSHVNTNAPFGPGEGGPSPYAVPAGQGSKHQKRAFPVLQGPGKLDSSHLFATAQSRPQLSTSSREEPDRREPQLPPMSPWLPEHEDDTIGGATSQPPAVENSTATASFTLYSTEPNWSTVWAGLSVSGNTWPTPSLIKPSVMETTSTWSRWSTTETDQVRGSTQATCDEREDLVHLLRRLEIGEQHADSLLEQGLSVHQLQTMTDNELRNIQLPMGPRLKLRKAIENNFQQS